ncbi:MAG TPA: hypothetical protein PLH64_01495 [Anaerolineaceae bacterium]|nr:hypothetical protein [Anaerolineaceae bacterium]
MLSHDVVYLLMPYSRLFHNLLVIASHNGRLSMAVNPTTITEIKDRDKGDIPVYETEREAQFLFDHYR